MTDNQSRIYLAGDEKGKIIRDEFMEFLKSKGKDCVDLGVFENDHQKLSIMQRELMEKVNEDHGAVGVMVFGVHKIVESEVESDS